MTGLRLTENAWQKQVIETAHRFGWICAHFPTSNPEGRYRTTVAADAKGYPDLTLVRERLVVIECKSEKGTLRTEQAVWIDRLLRAGVEAYVARPGDVEAVEAVFRFGSEWASWTLRSNLLAATTAEVARVLGKEVAA